MTADSARRDGPKLAIVLKGYPRLSETFIAQEIAALEARGLTPILISLRHPTDRFHHPVHERIKAKAYYLPEYLYQEPLRVLRGWWAARKLAGYRATLRQWLADLRRDPTPNRIRRFGQACVLAAELPPGAQWLHCHFLHTPASVTRYTAMIRGLQWSGSAHAKDIWTTPDWEIAEKLGDCRFLVTCTDIGFKRLQALAPDPQRVELLYHGLDFAHLPPAGQMQRPPRDGSDANDPVQLLSVGRCVEKKGFDDLLRALALLPKDLHWRLLQIGGGPLRPKLMALAEELGVEARCRFQGAQPQEDVFAAYRAADLFALTAKVAGDGDRDGLPNVLMEAQSNGLACLSTRVGAVEELIEHEATGLVSECGDLKAIAAGLERLMRDPLLREKLGVAGQQRVRAKFSFAAGIDRLYAHLGHLA
ncbi:MAG: distantly related to GDP-Man a-mannosyltransferase [Alphaproteobacteria bacterium]|nr:distantly related to GDP-Man a-mannosyltransferase [Alphaproteobacteria bacterium]